MPACVCVPACVCRAHKQIMHNLSEFRKAQVYHDTYTVREAEDETEMDRHRRAQGEGDNKKTI